MLERWITALGVEDAGAEPPAQTRERLKGLFAAGATRRMTQLGICLGAALRPVEPAEDDTLVYASTYAETRALEAYLDSFPAPSPTLFQTSIHPSSVQQNLIQGQQALRRFFPVTGGPELVAQALLVALLSDTPRAILCGGEERGGWLLEQGRASDHTFAFALALSTVPAGALGSIRIDPADTSSVASPPLAPLPLPDFFRHLRDRLPFEGVVAPGRRLVLRWSA
jgi:hypothetical protein